MSNLTVVNSANVFARNFLRSLKAVEKSVILGDIYNSRTSFLHFLHNQRKFENKSFHHTNISSKLLLEEAIRPSKNVLYFTHDYFSLVQDKNTQLKYTADVCKAYGVEKLVCVCPIELDSHYTAGGIVSDPIKEFNEARDYVLQTFPKTVFIRSNLIFGSESYFIRFLIKNWLNWTEVWDGEKYKQFRFNPLIKDKIRFYDDLNEIINLALTDESLEGKKLIANGKDSVSFQDINNLIKQAYNTSEKPHLNHQQGPLNRIFNAWQLFVHGNNHILNMEYFLDYYNHHPTNFSDYENIVDKVKLETQHNFKTYYLEHKKENDDYLLPLTINYYKNSLN